MNIKDIAKLAGVSVASVSRTVNGKDREKVSPRVREKILRICEEQRYAPNAHMLRMTSHRADTMAFLIPGNFCRGDGFAERMDDNLSAAILGAEEELSLSSTFLTLAVLSESFLASKTYLKLHRNQAIDGMLVWGWAGEGYLQELVAEGVPTVLLQGEAEGLPLSSVSPQDREGMSMLVDHVVACGHRDIAIITPLLFGSVGRARHQGALEALRAHGLAPSWVASERGYSIEVGYLACKEILARAPGTTCVMASNDLCALGVIKAARELGLDVPGRLSVTGADGLEFYGQVALTTYASPSYAVGREAVKLLRDVVEKPGRTPERVRMPVKFIPGATVAKLDGDGRAFPGIPAAARTKKRKKQREEV